MIKQFKENDLVPETTLRTQHKKSLIFGILGKGGTHGSFLESSNFGIR